MKYVFLLVILLSINDSIAQNPKPNSKFSYQHTVSFYGSQAISRVEDLFYNGSESLFVIYSKDLKVPNQEKTISKSDGGNVSLTMNGIEDTQDFTLYKNYSQKVMISREFLSNGGKCIVKDAIPMLKWNMTTEKKKIGPYMCQKATTIFRCAEYEAWFTTEIPLQIGPWKLGGLPGLIVELIDERENVTYKYSLISAEYPSTKTPYSIIPPKTKESTYTFAEFAKIQIKEIEKQRIFAAAAAEDPSNSGYISTRPECYDDVKVK